LCAPCRVDCRQMSLSNVDTRASAIRRAARQGPVD
jgi:hypothetical protein